MNTKTDLEGNGVIRRDETLAELAADRQAPAALRAVCSRALARSPSDRYQTVSELKDDVLRWLADEPVSVYRPVVHERCLRWIRRHRSLSAAGLVLAVSLVAFGVNLFRLTLLERMDQLTRSLVSEVASGTEAVLALQSYFATEDTVTRESFGQFARPYLARRKEIQALEYIPRVDRADRADYEQAARSADLAGFTFTEYSPATGMSPAAEREEYFPVFYAEPYQGNEEALGFDLASSPVRRAALHTAQRTKAIAATSPVSLVQDTGHSLGTLVICPLLSSVPASTNTQATGYVLGVYHIHRLLASAWQDIPMDHLTVAVYDVTEATQPVLVWTNASPGESPETEPRIRDGLAIPFGLLSTESRVWDRSWEIVLKARPGFLLYYPFSR